jgi:hypothetical protein
VPLTELISSLINQGMINCTPTKESILMMARLSDREYLRANRKTNVSVFMFFIDKTVRQIIHPAIIILGCPLAIFLRDIHYFVLSNIPYVSGVINGERSN